MLPQLRKRLLARHPAGAWSHFLSLTPWVLLGALAAQAATPGLPQPSGAAGPAAPSSTASASPAQAAPRGPTVSEFRAAFPGGSVNKVDPVTFNQYVSLHPGQGRLLTGQALASVVAAAQAKPAAASPPDSQDCDSLPAGKRAACRDSAAALAASAAAAPRAIREMQAREAARKDSLARDSAASKPAAPREDADPGDDDSDTLILGAKPAQGTQADHTRANDYEAEERTGWFVNLFADMRDGHGGGGWSGDDWAAVIYVVIGVVVVGAFIIYGVQTLTELAINKDGYPMFMEAGLRLSYSGKAFQDPNGNGDLYRDAYLAGLRYAVGFDRPGMGIGVAVEGGYIDVFLRGIDDPSKTFDFKGGYLVAGPMLRFGDNEPWSFSLEFLNGTSNHASIGWISKSRMTLQAKVARHTLVGAHLGAVFYDLHFLDGLGVREGNFNRDLSLVYGLDTGWEF